MSAPAYDALRIGTWNLAGRWSDSHRDFLVALDCDVWLLTEVDERLNLPGYARHLTNGQMATGRRWAGVLSRRDLKPLPDPHPASAAASVAGLTFCSSILPWKGSGGNAPWLGATHAERTESAIKALLQDLPKTALVWGGDWNHAFSGTEYAGSTGGRFHLQRVLDDLDLTVPTAALAHRLDGLLSIDHIAVGPGQNVEAASRHVALTDARHLSDHDAYVVELS